MAISFFSSDDFREQVCKMTKMKPNYMTNMNMNVSGTVCQLIHYFPSKYVLAINMQWSALISKQLMCTEFTADSRAYLFLMKNISCYCG